jgi:DNA-binding transcriptional regulator YiaG
MASPVTPNRIGWYRESLDLSPRQLSMRLDPTGNGPHDTTISRWERGDTGVPDQFKLRLAEIFGCSVVWLMGWEHQPSERDKAPA